MQASGFEEILAGAKLRVMLGPVDKAIYQNRIDLRTQTVGSQASANLLPSSTIKAEFIQTATYRVRTRSEYSEIDIAEAGTWNVALPEAFRLAMRQGIFTQIRGAALYGYNAGNSEGLVNAPGATSVNLPPDSYGNTTLTTYDNGQLAIWFLGLVQGALQRMYRLGGPARICILGPQRIIGTMQLQNIVQVTSYQRPGAGSATSAQVVKVVSKEFDIDIEWAYDDTLLNQGGANIDYVLIGVPEAAVPRMPGINTNEFNMLKPNQTGMILQYADVAAPVETTTPIPEGLDVVSQMRISSGWVPRGQALTIASIPYQ